METEGNFTFKRSLLYVKSWREFVVFVCFAFYLFLKKNDLSVILRDFSAPVDSSYLQEMRFYSVGNKNHSFVVFCWQGFNFNYSVWYDSGFCSDLFHYVSKHLFYACDFVGILARLFNWFYTLLVVYSAAVCLFLKLLSFACDVLSSPTLKVLLVSLLWFWLLLLRLLLFLDACSSMVFPPHVYGVMLVLFSYEIIPIFSTLIVTPTPLDYPVSAVRSCLIFIFWVLRLNFDFMTWGNWYPFWPWYFVEG